MKKVFFLLLGFFIVSCSTIPTPNFETEKVCSKESLKYLQSQQKTKKQLFIESLSAELQATQERMQTCYNEFRARTGKEEFNTCLVVGVDKKGKTEFFNFSSREAALDKKFIECAHQVTKSVQYGKHGKNYVMVQSYQFYYQ
jgi:hypothetical protein